MHDYALMANSSGAYQEGSCCNNTNVQEQAPVKGEWGIPTFPNHPTISLDWSPEEQAILEEGLDKFACYTSIVRYAKIAIQLNNKTVRDVALRHKWMIRTADIIKRRKDELNAKRIKDGKEKVIEPLARSPCLGIQPGLLNAHGMVSNFTEDIASYDDVDRATRQLLQQNAWVFKQISANLVTHQVHENISLLSQARDNIFKILANLNEMGPAMKKLPYLPKVNQELANTILPPIAFQIQ